MIPAEPSSKRHYSGDQETLQSETKLGAKKLVECEEPPKSRSFMQSLAARDPFIDHTRVESKNLNSKDGSRNQTTLFPGNFRVVTPGRRPVTPVTAADNKVNITPPEEARIKPVQESHEGSQHSKVSRSYDSAFKPVNKASSSKQSPVNNVTDKPHQDKQA